MPAGISILSLRIRRIIHPRPSADRLFWALPVLAAAPKWANSGLFGNPKLENVRCLPILRTLFLPLPPIRQACLYPLAPVRPRREGPLSGPRRSEDRYRYYEISLGLCRVGLPAFRDLCSRHSPGWSIFTKRRVTRGIRWDPRRFPDRDFRLASRTQRDFGQDSFQLRPASARAAVRRGGHSRATRAESTGCARVH